MRRSILVAAMVVLGGCATGYHPVGYSGGYSEMRLNERSYLVSFSGNGHTSPALAHAYAMRRAAELTVAAGASHFAVVADDASESTTQAPGSSVCSPDALGQVRCTHYAGGVVSKPQRTLRIVILAPNEATSPYAMDARLVLAQTPAR